MPSGPFDESIMSVCLALSCQLIGDLDMGNLCTYLKFDYLVYHVNLMTNWHATMLSKHYIFGVDRLLSKVSM